MLDLSDGYKSCLNEEFDDFTQGPKAMEDSQLQIPLFSSLQAKKLNNSREFGPQYWVDNLTSPVLFNSAVSCILQEIKNPLFLEIGPHSTLQGPTREICVSKKSKFDYIPTMLRGKNCMQVFLSAIGQLYQQDIHIDFAQLYANGKVLTDIPSYPWSLKEKYWYEPRISRDWRQRRHGHHELLGRRVAESTSITPLWRVVLVPDHVPWVVDHKVREDTVLPFAGFMCMAGEAIRQLTGVEAGYKIKNARVTTALVLGDAPKEITTAFRKQPGSDYYDFNIASHNGSTWITHCEGMVKAVDKDLPTAEEPPELPRVADVARWFTTFAKVGFNYGPKFQRLEGLAAATITEAATASVHMSEEIANAPFLFHPTSMDASLQLAIIAGARGLPRNYTDLKVPTEIDELEVYRAAPSMRAVADTADDGSMSVECVAGGQALLRIRGLRFTLLPNENPASQQHTDGAYLRWHPDFDFIDEAAALVKPPSDNSATHLLEEFSFLCVLDAASRLKGQKPASLHFEKYGKWMSLKAKMAASRQLPILNDPARLLDLSNSERSKCIADKYSQLLRIPSRAPYAVAIKQIHDNIEGLYDGSVDAAQLLMEDDILPKLYTAINFNYANYISLMSNSRPTLRILEVGAGAGGTTDTILSAIVGDKQLPPYSVYTYTDLSPGFFPQARDRFKDAPNIEYKVLDISKDPLTQGFQAGFYDVILAPYVVHATPHLRQTLKNLNTILKPDGRLLLSEPSTVGLSPNLIFGVFASWWSGAADGREWEPFVTSDRWDADLKESGFTGIDSIVDDTELHYRYWSTIITRPVGQITERNDTSVVLVAEDHTSKLSVDLAEGLAKAGFAISKKGLTDDVADEHNVVFALDLEKPFLQDISPSGWATFKALMKRCESNRSRKLLWLLPPQQKNCDAPSAALSIGLLRSVRAELDLSLTTLEVDPAEPELGRFVSSVYEKTLKVETPNELLPDCEFLVENGKIHVGRYLPFSIDEELSRKVHHVSERNHQSLSTQT